MLYQTELQAQKKKSYLTFLLIIIKRGDSVADITKQVLLVYACLIGIYTNKITLKFI